ncbi:MAG: hypothetical protein JJU29_09785 [Verrucomicrobia bacterium]|nr:hypothetical protein [Verrucomicrobiota bacterium]MCH8511517.1 hypothetical protein [Kiritimatiellia bacterium]
MKIWIYPFLVFWLAPFAFSAPEYLRVSDAPGGTRVLEIAVRTFAVPGSPARSLSLVGVSHIGTAHYYETLQTLLDSADLVLFEGVGADEDDFRNPDRAQIDEASSMQVALARALELEFQLHAIDYDRDHFVNSDMTVLEMFALFRGENPDELSEEALQRLRETLETMQGQGLGGQMMEMMMGRVESHPGFRRGFAWAMVEILGTLRGDMSEMKGLPPDMRELLTILLDKRNDVVVRDVVEALGQPEPPGHTMIFYGAAHMYDLEKRLVEKFSLEPIATQWLPAFSGNLQASGLNAMQKRMLTWYVQQQVQTMRMMMPEKPENTTLP